jgi:hypothetical protein
VSASDRDQHIQNRLVDVATTAGLVHRLRALEGEVQALLEDAQRHAAADGIPQSMIATVAGVSQPRVSKITSKPARLSTDALRARLFEISEWPGEALKAHRDGSPGRMLYPPYERPVTRWVPTVWRRDREWVQPDGRRYGETSPAEQEQADRRYWAVGVEVRAQSHPLVLAIEGTIERVYEVAEWIREDGQTKWTALSTGGQPWVRDSAAPTWVPAWWPDALTPGQPLEPPARQGAYTPARIAPDGAIHRAVRP